MADENENAGMHPMGSPGFVNQGQVATGKDQTPTSNPGLPGDGEGDGAPFDKRQQDWLRAMIGESTSQIIAAMGGSRAGAGNPLVAGGGKMGSGPGNVGTGPPFNPNNSGTPNNDFISGVKGKLSYTMAGVATPLDYPVTMYSFDQNLETDDITNSDGNGWKIRLDGLQEITGNVTFVWDSGNIPGTTLGTVTAAPSPWRTRSFPTLYLKPDGVTTMQVPVLISGISYSSGPKAGTLLVTAKYESSGIPTLSYASQTTPTAMLM